MNIKVDIIVLRYSTYCKTPFVAFVLPPMWSPNEKLLRHLFYDCLVFDDILFIREAKNQQFLCSERIRSEERANKLIRFGSPALTRPGSDTV